MGAAAIWLRTVVLIIQKDPSKFLSYYNAIVYDMVGMCQTISGVVLVKSVLAIRSFF